MEMIIIQDYTQLHFQIAVSYASGINNAKAAINGNDANQPSTQKDLNSELVLGEMDAVLKSLDQAHIIQGFEELSNKRRNYMKRSLEKLQNIVKETPVAPVISRIVAILDETAKLDADMKEIKRRNVDAKKDDFIMTNPESVAEERKVDTNLPPTATIFTPSA